MNILSQTEVIALCKSKQALFWDFDGVLLDSMEVRDQAFEIALKGYPREKVDALLAYHRANGGWSRYAKFKYFQSEILGIPIDELKVEEWANQFSKHCYAALSDTSRLIPQGIAMVRGLAGQVPMHIVSGSDGTELRALCEALKIGELFEKVDGSPMPKIELISRVLNRQGYDPKRCLMIGDAKNDYDAATANSMPFLAFRFAGVMPALCEVWQEDSTYNNEPIYIQTVGDT